AIWPHVPHRSAGDAGHAVPFSSRRRSSVLDEKYAAFSRHYLYQLRAYYRPHCAQYDAILRRKFAFRKTRTVCFRSERRILPTTWNQRGRPYRVSEGPAAGEVDGKEKDRPSTSYV